MKYLYLLFFMGFTLVLSAQEISGDASLQLADSSGFNLYPNPAFDDVVYVTTPRNAGKDVTVYDIFGKVVLRARITSNVLNISSLIPGVYFLRVEEAGKAMTRKLVVK